VAIASHPWVGAYEEDGESRLVEGIEVLKRKLLRIEPTVRRQLL